MKKIFAILISLFASLSAYSLTIPGYGETYEKDGIWYLVCNTWYQPGGKHLVVVNPELIDYLYEESKLYYPENDAAKASVRHFADTPPVYSQYYKGDIVIPHSVEYDSEMWPVDWINECAFCGCDSLTSVTLPSSIETIGDWAFARCPMLKDVEIPDSVVDLGKFIFSGSPCIKNFKLPPFIVSYNDCDLKYSDINLIFPDNIPVLDKGYLPTFYNWAINTNRKAFTLPKSRFALYSECFRSCSGMESIIIPDIECFASVSYNTELGPFSNCKDLKVIVSLATVPPQITTRYRDPYGYETRPAEENQPWLKHPRKIVEDEEYDYPLEKFMNIAGGLSGKVLIVPLGSEQAYATAPCWSDFNDVRGNRIIGLSNIGEYAEELQLKSDMQDIASDITDELSAYTEDGMLHIRSAAGGSMPLMIHDLSGRLVHASPDSSADITLPNGIYIVTSGHSRIKAIVR